MFRQVDTDGDMMVDFCEFLSILSYKKDKMLPMEPILEMYLIIILKY